MSPRRLPAPTTSPPAQPPQDASSTEADASGVVRQRVVVPFEYAVAFTKDVFAPASSVLVSLLSEREPTRRHRVFVVLDAGLEAAWPELRGQIASYFAHHSERLELVAPPLTVPGGESTKNDPALIGRLHAVFAEHRLDRHSFVLIVGGGSVLDAVGFATATTHRGLRTVRLPTTVLGQDDSGVGVKNGINAFGAKNFIGTFAPPYAVINDVRFLERLPRRDVIAGLAEGVKVALIRDAEFFAYIEAHADALAEAEPNALGAVIRRCAELHMRHIATGGDPFELGSARPLDFGHWAAHRLETMTAHELRHGEAVAIGMSLDCRYATLTGLLPDSDRTRITRVLRRLGLPTYHPALASEDAQGRLAVLKGLDDFREHLGGDLTITMLEGIGRTRDVHEMDEALVIEAIALQRRDATDHAAAAGVA